MNRILGLSITLLISAPLAAMDAATSPSYTTLQDGTIVLNSSCQDGRKAAQAISSINPKHTYSSWITKKTAPTQLYKVDKKTVNQVIVGTPEDIKELKWIKSSRTVQTKKGKAERAHWSSIELDQRSELFKHEPSRNIKNCRLDTTLILTQDLIESKKRAAVLTALVEKGGAKALTAAKDLSSAQEKEAQLQRDYKLRLAAKEAAIIGRKKELAARDAYIQRLVNEQATDLEALDKANAELKKLSDLVTPQAPQKTGWFW